MMMGTQKGAEASHNVVSPKMIPAAAVVCCLHVFLFSLKTVLPVAQAGLKLIM